jgi:hypothetical protein
MVAGRDDSSPHSLDHPVRDPKSQSVGSTEAPRLRVRLDMTAITMRSHRRRLMNQAMDAYAGWRDQCSAVDLAYRHWAAARGHDAAVWYTAYSAALAREERAAERYAQVTRRVGSLVAADLGPKKGLAGAAGGR